MKVHFWCPQPHKKSRGRRSVSGFFVSCAARWQGRVGESVLEGEVDTEVHVELARHRHAGLGHLGKRVVHAHEHVEALRVQVQHPAERSAVSAFSEAHAGRENLAGSVVGREAELRPRVLALDLRRVHEAQRQGAVEGAAVFGRSVDGSRQCLRALALVALVLQFVECRQALREAVPLVVERVRGRVVGVEHIVVRAHRLAAVRRGQHVVVPVDEAQVEQREAELPVLVELVRSTEVKGQTPAVEARLVDVHAAHILVFRFAAFGAAQFRVLVEGQVLHAGLDFSVGRGHPLVLVEFEAGILELRVDVAAAEQELHLTAHAPLLVDVAAVAVSHFEESVGMHVRGREVVHAVVRALLRHAEEFAGEHHADVRAEVHADGLVAFLRLEAHGEDVHLHLRVQLVLIVDVLQKLLRGNLVVHEEHRLAAARIDKVAEAHVAAVAHVEVTQAGESHIAVAVRDRRVHLVAVEVAVVEEARRSLLCKGTRGGEAERSAEKYFRKIHSGYNSD